MPTTPNASLEILTVIDELEHLVEASKSMPLTSHRLVEEAAFLPLTARLKKIISEYGGQVPETHRLEKVLLIVEELELQFQNSPLMPLTQQRLLEEDAFFVQTQRLKNALPESILIANEDAHLDALAPAPAPAGLPRLRRADTLLLIVDVQEKLMPVIHQAERVEANCAVLAKAARELRLPMVVTEQYPEKLGATAGSVREAAGFPTAIGKLRFSACTEQTLAAIESSGRKTVLLCGVEAHVCVLQTALDLRERGYQVFAARDALSSRTPENAQIGWERMQSAGVLPTSTESALFELLEEAGTPDFKAILPLIK